MALQTSAELHSELSPSELRGHLKEAVEPLAEGFSLVSKLSPGGIVIRVLRAPVTERPFFGRIGHDDFRIAMVPRGQNQSPFQPVIAGRLSVAGEGTHVSLELAPHPDARSFSLVFGGVAVMLGLLGIYRILQDPVLGGLALLFAFGFATLPTLRARHGFEIASQESLALLRANLPIRR